MKKQKKFGRKLTLNKETIGSLGQWKAVGGGTALSVCLCPLTVFPNCTNPKYPCNCQEPLTY